MSASVYFVFVLCLTALFAVEVRGNKRLQGTGEGRRCKFGSMGACFLNEDPTSCPVGSSCLPRNSGSNDGECCKIIRGKRGIFGGGGTCGGFAGTICPPGYYCRMSGGSTLGVCVRFGTIRGPLLPFPMEKKLAVALQKQCPVGATVCTV